MTIPIPGAAPEPRIPHDSRRTDSTPRPTTPTDGKAAEDVREGPPDRTAGSTPAWPVWLVPTDPPQV